MNAMASPVKNIAVLGSTGSIGRQTLDVARALPGRFRVVGLAAGSNLELLSAQAAEFRPDFIAWSDAESGLEVTPDCKRVSLEEMACLPAVDTLLVSTSGTAGLKATLAAVKAGKTVALANKESLVAAGKIITAEVASSGAHILPVDSEHSAIWQCLNGEGRAIRRIILTASGGPFRDYAPERMAGITVGQALAHPSWKMGRKVTIDSATLMNKGLEVIEARWLFGVAIDDIKVVVHPQSIVHSMVEFVDGSVKAQLSRPDMRLPIQYALTWPERLPNPSLPSIDWDELDSLAFERPDTERFPCLRLAVEAGRRGGTFPAALCGADDAAVELFLEGRIGFTGIASLVESVLERHDNVEVPSLEEIIQAGQRSYALAMEIAAGGDGC
jgi:1-deoxy-D-xylulose-5-phosphate reductoisomerase